MLQADPPLVCAHGGDATVAAPNTLAAMNAALEAGAQCIEVDVALTKDGSVVCLHMRQLTQWTDQSLLQVHLKRKRGWLQQSCSAFDIAEIQACISQVGDLTLAEVLDLQGPQNETVPLLEDVIRLLHHGVTRLIIDIKLHVRFLATCLIYGDYCTALPSTQKPKPSCQQLPISCRSSMGSFRTKRPQQRQSQIWWSNIAAHRACCGAQRVTQWSCSWLPQAFPRRSWVTLSCLLVEAAQLRLILSGCRMLRYGALIHELSS